MPEEFFQVLQFSTHKYPTEEPRIHNEIYVQFFQVHKTGQGTITATPTFETNMKTQNRRVFNGSHATAEF
jgi:hypothetical protein